MYLSRCHCKPLRGSIQPRRLLFFALVITTALSARKGLERHERCVSSCRAAGRSVVVYQVPLSRPLVSLDVVSCVLNVSPEEAKGLIENGCLYAFELSRKETRPLVRVIASSLANYTSRQHAPNSAPGVQQLIDEIFPSRPVTIGAAYLSRRWSCDPDHVLNLWRAGLLRAAKGASCKPGPGGSPSLDFESVADFMKARLMA